MSAIPTRKTRLRLVWEGGQQEVGWYGDASDEEVLRLVRSALGLPQDTEVVAKLEGNVVALNDCIPDGTALKVEAVPQSSFRGQVLKFETIQAHLANERTLLAWIRTSLSSLSLAFSLLFLVSDASTHWLAVSFYSSGGCFVLSVFTTFLTGYLRFLRVRDALKTAARRKVAHLHRLGLKHQALFLAVICSLLTLVYLLGGITDLQ